ncbi:hypothetical protein D3C85_881450 [compost metagenome]
MTEPEQCALNVYCTTSGDLPKLVADKSPMCFVPYSEAILLQQRLISLESAVELLLEGNNSDELYDLYNIYLEKYHER